MAHLGGGGVKHGNSEGMQIGATVISRSNCVGDAYTRGFSGVNSRDGSEEVNALASGLNFIAIFVDWWFLEDCNRSCN